MRAAEEAGVIGLCQALARQLGPYGITSNAVAPGLIDTDIAERNQAPGMLEQMKARSLETIPMRRVGTPEDVAAALHFLASEAAGYVNGEIMDVNGGVYFD